MVSFGGTSSDDFANLFLSDTIYNSLKFFIKRYNIDGIDIDVDMGSPQIMTYHVFKLIKNLKNDFGEKFIVSLAPIASAFIEDKNISRNIDFVLLKYYVDFYNVQFDSENIQNFEHILQQNPDLEIKLNICLFTDPDNENEHIDIDQIIEYINDIDAKHIKIHGICGWEYNNATQLCRDWIVRFNYIAK